MVLINCLCLSAAGGATTDVFLECSGVVHGFEHLKGEHEGDGGIDFCFQFTPMGEQDRWLVISRGSTPFMQYRLGPTYLGIEREDLPDGTQVRLLGVKGIDRVPESFHSRQLPSGKTVTALILAKGNKALRENKDLLYVNNWFHPWREGIHGILDKQITQYYIDLADPFWVCGWLPMQIGADGIAIYEPAKSLLDPRDFTRIAQPPLEKVLFRGHLVRNKDVSLGYQMRASQLWKRNPLTGGYDLIVGDDRNVEVRTGR